MGRSDKNILVVRPSSHFTGSAAILLCPWLIGSGLFPDRTLLNKNKIKHK